jgi:hypothetical protein
MSPISYPCEYRDVPVLEPAVFAGDDLGGWGFIWPVEIPFIGYPEGEHAGSRRDQIPVVRAADALAGILAEQAVGGAEFSRDRVVAVARVELARNAVVIVRAGDVEMSHQSSPFIS